MKFVHHQESEQEHYKAPLDHVKCSSDDSQGSVSKLNIQISKNDYYVKPLRIKSIVRQVSPSPNDFEPEQNIQFIKDPIILNENKIQEIQLSKNIDKKSIPDLNLSHHTVKERKITSMNQKRNNSLRPSLGGEDVLERVEEDYSKNKQ